MASSSLSPEVEVKFTSAATTSAETSGATTPSRFVPPSFARIGDTTCISRPSERSPLPTSKSELALLAPPLLPIASSRKLSHEPSHVVIFGWMDAPLRLVAKYAQPYAILFPQSTILIKLSDGKSYLANETVRRQQLQTIINEIVIATEQSSHAPELGDSTVTLIDPAEGSPSSLPAAAPRGIVIHSFSDGGAGNLALFLDQMSVLTKTSPDVRLPTIFSLIMDSSPGKSSPKTGSTAFTMHLSNRPKLRALVRFFVWLMLWTLKVWTAIKGDLPRGEKMRRRLNSLRSWDWLMTLSAASAKTSAAQRPAHAVLPPRMYMYTKSDQLIPWQFVEEHARDLANSIWPNAPPRLVEMEDTKQRDQDLSSSTMSVELRRWNTPAHCSIGRTDFPGYWTAISQFYQSILT